IYVSPSLSPSTNPIFRSPHCCIQPASSKVSLTSHHVRRQLKKLHSGKVAGPESASQLLQGLQTSSADVRHHEDPGEPRPGAVQATLGSRLVRLPAPHLQKFSDDSAIVGRISKGVSVNIVEEYTYLQVYIDLKLDWAKNTHAF
ncbi:unnamed protein product, partial [Pleuronectes platessa]